MDAADISHCFSNPVKTLSHLSSRHSKVTPTAQLGLASIGDSVEMMNNRACILDASSRRMKPRRVLKHSSKESMPIHHCSPSLRTCDFFRHAIKKKNKRDCNNENVFLCEACTHTIDTRNNRASEGDFRSAVVCCLWVGSENTFFRSSVANRRPARLS